MTRSSAGTCVHDIQSFITSSRRGRKYLTEGTMVDSSLALAFYNFLTEGSDRLPSHEYVNRVIENSNYDCISEGYGIVVNIENGEDLKKLVIELSIPINDRRVRIDRISCEKHIIYVDHYGRMGRVEVDPNNTKVLSKIPEVNLKRVKFLQNYLSKLQIKEQVKVNKLVK